jgi:hypothetical protein
MPFKFGYDHNKARRKALRIMGDKCVRCGFSDWRALQFDHVDGDGHQESRSGNTGIVIRKILRNICREKFQILCANCNWIKRYENQEDGGRRKKIEEVNSQSVQEINTSHAIQRL